MVKMDSAKDDPLIRIQREISEVVEREQELRNTYYSNHGLHTAPILEMNSNDIFFNNNDEIEDNNNKNQNGGNVNGISKSPVLQRAFSTSTLLTSSHASITPARRIFPNVDKRGLMQRFLKMHVKLNTNGTNGTNNGSSPPVASVPNNSPTPAWYHDPIAVIKTSETPEKFTRKGYVPVEQRIRCELEEMHSREVELKAFRRKTFAASQPDLLAFLDENDANGSSPQSLSPTPISMTRNAYLSDGEDVPNDTISEPTSLRPARSLAQLCNDLDENDVPSSSMLIAKFESIIQKNRQSNGKANAL